MAGPDARSASRAGGRKRIHDRSRHRRSAAARHLAPLSPLDAGLILMPGQPATQAANDDRRSMSALELHHQVTQFLYKEALLQDLHDYDGWEPWWEEDRTSTSLTSSH